MIMEPMDAVRQTGKTIIFEKFNDDIQKMNLVTLLTRNDQEISLEKFNEYLMGKESELVVHSFPDFVEKFSPIIYETVVTLEDGTPRFVYSLEKPRGNCTEIKLKDHALYKMVMNLIDRKGHSDRNVTDFPYDDLKKMLSPEAEMEECKQIRRNLDSCTKEYQKLLNSGNSEVGSLPQDIKAIRKKIVDKYQNKSPLGFLPVVIADKQRQIDELKKAGESQDKSGDVKAINYTYTFDECGNLKLIEQVISDDTVPEIAADNNSRTQLVEVIRNDFKKSAPIAIRDNTYIGNLVVNLFVPSDGGSGVPSVQDRVELEAEKKNMLDVYRSSLESFSKAVVAVIEKFAGMKSFFDHASYDGKLPRDVSVIIANCKVDAILNNEIAKKRFKKYFSELSNEKDVNRIWFGVIPAISTGELSTVQDNKDSDPFGDLSDESTSVKKDATGLVGLDTAKEMLAILTEAKIMTFVNYKAGEQTGFIELTDTKVNQYKRDFESVNSEYAVMVYPNFTILPKEKTSVKVGSEYNASMGEEIDSFLKIPGIYLDASYVACGMMVGIQNYSFLKSKGYMVKPKYPCVRFDLEDPDNSKRITTKLNRETTTEMQKQVKNAIMEDRFGFVFAGNNIIFDGKVLNNSYVINARSLKREEGGKYKSLYKTLIKNVVDQLLRKTAENVTDDIVGRFIVDYVDTWKRDNKDDDRKYANRMLLEGETIELDSAKHKLIVRYNKEQDIWDDIVINDSETEG